MIEVRPFTAVDGPECLRLFRDTVRSVNSMDYEPRQIAAWSSDQLDAEDWIHRFHGRFAYIARAENTLLGFTDMDCHGYLDRLFVSAAHLRQGVATALFSKLLADARLLHLPHIVADVSITAKPFFVKMGFGDPVRKTVTCRGVTFVNYRMTFRVGG